MKKSAFYTALSQKLRDKEILFLDKIILNQPKTKEAVEIFKKISSIKNFEKILSKRKNLAIIVLPKKDDNLIRGFRNLAGVKVSEARNLNVLDLLKYKFLVFSNTKETINAI